MRGSLLCFLTLELCSTMQAPFLTRPVAGQRVLNPDFSFQNSAIIKPPEIEKHEFKTTRIMIDSRDRNTDLFPNPANYEVTMTQEIDDAVAATIIVADIPHTSYLINPNNYELTVLVDTDEVTASLPFGNYTPSDLATEIQTALNNAVNAANVAIIFQVEYHARLDKYVFTANREFSVSCEGGVEPYGDAQVRTISDASGNLVRQIVGQTVTPYRKNSIGKMIGFPRKVVSSDANGRLEAPFRKNFTDANMIVLHIEQMRLYQSDTTHVNKSILVLHGTSTRELGVFSSNTEYRASFSPPIPRLSKIRLTFYNAWGELYDFQNYDHRIEMLIESSKQKNKYNL